MSSTRRATQACTLPASAVRSTSMAFLHSVNHSKVLSPLSEVKVTLLAPPASGETVMEFLPLDVFSLIHLRTADSANKFPSGVKNLRSMQVPGDTMTLVYYRDHFATSLAKIGAQLLAFLFFQT